MKPLSTLIFACVVVAIGISQPAGAGDACTLIADAQTGKVLAETGSCDQRASPASSFKLALSLMGYDAGILIDAHNPAWPYKDEYKAAMPSWHITTDPTIWLEDSIVWYSQVLTKTLGPEKFQAYVDQFEYGNHDISGDAGRDNGLTNSWLSSSLQISPAEQVAFVRKMLAGKLPVSRQAVEMTKAIMPTFPAENEWTIFGKTGSGFQRGPDGKLDRNRQFGWFIGWATQNKRTVIFARLIRDDEKTEGSAGPRARAQLIDELPGLVGKK